MTPAERQKGLREKRKKLGLCILCGNTSRPGKNCCLNCQEKRTKSCTKYSRWNREKINSNTRKRYGIKVGLGQCAQCSKPNVSSRLCGSCSKQINDAHKKSYYNHIQRQECVNCGNLHSEDSILCNDCRQKRLAHDNTPEVVLRKRLHRVKSWRQYLYSIMIHRAKKRGIFIDPNLSPNDIPDPNGLRCPVFGWEYEMGVGKRHNQSATIDRINPEWGYFKENIQLLSNLANSIKSDADPDSIYRVALAVIDKEKNSGIVINDYNMSDEKIRRKMIINKRCQNKRRNRLDFDIEWYNIRIPEVCPCLGIRLDRNQWETKPSIDRIDNKKGYVKGNIWVISTTANTIKCNANGQQIMDVYNYVKNQ